VFVFALAGLGLGTRLIFKVPRPGDSEGTFSVSSQAATSVSLSVLPKDTTSELAGLSLH